MIKVAAYLFQVAFIYAVFLFVLLEPNPIKWSEGSRSLYALAVFCAWFVMLMMPPPRIEK